LHYKPNLPLAIVEAKDNNHTVGAGMQQALGYAEILKDVPFVFSSNGDGFLFHDRTVKSGPVEKEITLDEFPSPEELWQRYCASRDIPAAIQPVVTQDYYPIQGHGCRTIGATTPSIAMNRATFFKHFDLLAEQPDAVAKMREFVFQLAIQGRLVPQDHNDEPVSELLKRIRAAMESFTKEGKNGKGKPTSGGSETPFKVPATWVWIRFGDIVRIRTGKLDANAAVENGAYPFFTCSQTPSRIATYSFDTSAVLLAGNGDFNLKYYVGKFDAYQRTYVIEPLEWDLRFCFILMSSQISRITENNRGSAIPYLKLGDIADPLVPLPPLAEQRRIVAKVDELMALCDGLEQQQQARQHARSQIQQSALHHLLAARETVTFAAAWQRVCDHFHLLHDTPDAIPQLRQAILQLAVQGRLVPQNPKDEPVSEQLLEIEKAKTLFVQKGLMRKSDSLSDVEADEMPYQIPSNWKWVRVGTVGMTQTGSTPPTANRDFFGDFIPFVKPADLTEREINYGGEGISESGVKQSTLIPTNSVLMVCIGGSIGKTNLNTRDVCCNQQINALTPFSKTESRYVMSCMKAAWFQQQVKRDAGQTTLPIISKGKWERLPFPLPPLAEQKRIVAKVDELMRWSDALEARLTAAQTTATHLLDATLHQILTTQ
jgi:type I restriction enzyme S subunit